MIDICSLSASALAAAVNRGVVQPYAVAEAFLDRVARINPTINALVHCPVTDVLTQADVLTKRLVNGEKPPLAGVPVVIKDNIWVNGWRVTQGSLLFRDFVAPTDALAVTRLRTAGALLLGLGNCPEFACRGVTENRVYGVTRNPWDLHRTPGGSSGGCASAVAAGLAPLAIGTDAGGSIRRPAAHTGIIGLMPTPGHIPHPIGFPEPAFGNNSLGAFARYSDDLWLMMQCLTASRHLQPIVKFTRHTAARLRIGYSFDMGLDSRVELDVTDCLSTVVRILQRAGLQVQPFQPLWPAAPAGLRETAIEALEQSALAVLYGQRLEAEPELFDPEVARQIEAGLRCSGQDVARALYARQALAEDYRRNFADLDVIICPSTPVTAWHLGQDYPQEIAGTVAAPRDHAVFSWFVNQAFATACSLPCGLDSQGLPIGLQLLAPSGQEETLQLLSHVLLQYLYDEIGNTCQYPSKP